VRWKNHEENLILKAVSNKASTNMRIVAVANKETVLTIGFHDWEFFMTFLCCKYARCSM
jgi:hypothetical protein